MMGGEGRGYLKQAILGKRCELRMNWKELCRKKKHSALFLSDWEIQHFYLNPLTAYKPCLVGRSL